MKTAQSSRVKSANHACMNEQMLPGMDLAPGDEQS